MNNFLLKTALVIITAASTLYADPPPMFRYQGRLVEGTNLVSGTLPMSFRLYDAPSGGSLLYEDAASVLVVDGFYSVNIGEHTVLGSLSEALGHPAVYLELTIDGEVMSPRERLVSVPYAMNTGQPSVQPGTIVLSETYPNPELEAQGYSAVTSAPGLDWDFVARSPSSFFGVKGGLSYAGKMWLFSSGSDAWHSEDGKEWVEFETDLPQENLHDTQFLVFNGKMWLISSRDQEVWSSTNGENWTLATSNPGWSSPSIATIVFDDKLWLIGGDSYSEVWSSVDGTNWVLVVESAPWGLQVDLLLGKINGGMLLVCESGDTWLSSDGSNWTLLDQKGPAIDVYDYSPPVFYENLFITQTLGRILSTPDGVNWHATTFAWDIGGMPVHLIVHNDELWCITPVDILRSRKVRKEGGFYHYRKD